MAAAKVTYGHRSSVVENVKCDHCVLSWQDYVTLMQENGEDVAKALVTEGLVTVEKRKEKRLQKLMEEYNKAQDGARKARVRPSVHSEGWTHC